MISSTSSSVLRIWCARWIGEVETKVWMRGRRACRTASPRAGDVALDGAGEAGDRRRSSSAAGDLRHRLEIALGGDREAGLDDVDAHLVEQFGDLELLLEGHGGAGALLAVAQVVSKMKTRSLVVACPACWSLVMEGS